MADVCPNIAIKPFQEDVYINANEIELKTIKIKWNFIRKKLKSYI